MAVSWGRCHQSCSSILYSLQFNQFRATILAKTMWTPDFSSAVIKTTIVFQENPPPPPCPLFNVVFRNQILKVCLHDLSTLNWGQEGENVFLSIISGQIYLGLIDARGVHDNFCQDCLKLSHILHWLISLISRWYS